MTHRRDFNVSRRLRRTLKASALPRVGKTHVLRMRYVQLTHTLCILQCHCTRGRILSAKSKILEGWADTAARWQSAQRHTALEFAGVRQLV
jgi:hypothetical protein